MVDEIYLRVKRQNQIFSFLCSSNASIQSIKEQIATIVQQFPSIIEKPSALSTNDNKSTILVSPSTMRILLPTTTTSTTNNNSVSNTNTTTTTNTTNTTILKDEDLLNEVGVVNDSILYLLFPLVLSSSNEHDPITTAGDGGDYDNDIMDDENNIEYEPIDYTAMHIQDGV